MRRILAIGGGGFQTEDGPSPIDHALLQLTGKTQPRICLLSTASGDLPEYIERFHAAFAEPSCVASHLAFYARDSRPGAVNLTNLREALHDQDAVFVSGGNMRAALAVWREYGLDRLLAEVLDAGVLLAGMSAGAMCWFEQALTDTFWQPGYRPLPGLGLLSGACFVHYS